MRDPRPVRPITASALALLLGAGAALAAPDAFDVHNVRPDDVLFLREAPSPSARKVGHVPPDGKGLKNLECAPVKDGRALPDSDAASGPSWCRVRYGASEGWANARYLRESAGTEVAQVAVGSRRYPASVAEAIRSNAEQCSTFKPGRGFSRNDVDLNADGVADWIIDYSDVECDGSASYFCGSGGCTLQVLTSQGAGNWVLKSEDTVQEYKIVAQKGRTVVRFGLHGSACGKVGAASCAKIVDFGKPR
jgi:hypothetical protein